MSEPKEIISATDLANYVVCPEAWRLKRSGLGHRRTSPRQAEGQRVRQEWVDMYDLSAKLRYYSKIVYALFVLIVIVLFSMDRRFTAKWTQIIRSKITAAESAKKEGS